MAHHTQQEALASLPDWRMLLRRATVALDTAIEAEDWAAVKRISVNIRWVGTNLTLRADDLIEHANAR